MRERFQLRHRLLGRRVRPVPLMLVLVTPAAAHSPFLDSDVRDWCIGALSNTYAAGGRVEDSAATLSCGRCSLADRACVESADCPSGETCIEPASKIENVWWDRRTDAAVNDLATLATTQDDTNLYFALEQWVSPDPVSLPFYEIALDVRPGGIGAWYDPFAALTDPGHCSVSVDRGCTTNADCHFCTISTEEPPSTRPRTCGSGCNPDLPGDVCDTAQTCVDVASQGPLAAAGVHADPAILADYVILLDTSRLLAGFPDPIQLLEADGGAWSPVGTFELPVNPGTSGESIPAAALEFAIPWSAFGCVGCPFACDCPDLGPGREFRLGGTIARGTFTLDFTPDGPIEDVLSEALAGATTTTTNSCPGVGTTTTRCELADQSQDAFVLAGGPAPGGRVDRLEVDKDAGASIRLTWGPSCSAADGDYEIYAGPVGDFTAHAPVAGLCTTGGATTAVITPAPDDVYYLVVPTDGSTEGSYGVDGAEAERPPSATPCRPQRLGDCPVPSGPQFSLSGFEQIRTTLDGVNTPSSDWGSLDLSFLGSGAILYFNLVADGQWRVRNLPILSTEGDGVVQTQTINFRVLPDGVPSGSAGSVELVATLSTGPVATAPEGPAIEAFFLLRVVELDSGEQGESLAHTTARNVIGGAATEWASNGSVPDQEAGPGECVPVALSNSLTFLDGAHGLGIPDESLSVDAMKTATGWTPGGAPLGLTPWWDRARAAFGADPQIPVTTTATASFEAAMAALQSNCDVLLRAPGHAAVVRGLIRLAGGNHAIVIQHDTRQDWDFAGAKREIVIHDAGAGTLGFGWGFDGKPFDRFVVECPE